MKKESMITIPDYITFVRFALIPAIIALILYGHFASAFVLYIIAALSDAVDGITAKLLQQKTYLGGMLDALADRCLGVGVVIALIMAGNIIAPWAFVIFCVYAAMELSLGACITLKYRKFYLFLVHRDSIRHFAVIIFTVIAGYVLNWQISILFADILLIASLFFAVYTTVDYTRYIRAHPKRWR